MQQLGSLAEGGEDATSHHDNVNGILSGEKEVVDDNMATVARTAMGEYVPRRNGKPLTQLALPTPGPADYKINMSITKPTNPRYSIVGKARERSYEDTPGPNKYSTATCVTWKDKTITLKGKSNSHPQRSRDHMGQTSYLVTYGNLGTSAPKYTFGWKPKKSFWLITGPPNKLVQPVDTVGFKTPGPAEHRPSSAYWGKGPRKSIGLGVRGNLHSTPGPGEYDIPPNKPGGPSYSFGKRLEKSAGNDTPGPGAYDIGTTIGKAMAKSISGRQLNTKEDGVPSPNNYTLPSCIEEGPQHSMTYRAFEPAVDSTPGPAEYHPTNGNLAKAAEYSCRKMSRPVYPDILHYKEHDLMRNKQVGPGRYETCNNAAKNDGPSYSMGRRFQDHIEESPGPATYKVFKPYRPDAGRAPEFSMGKRIEKLADKTSPGPAAYSLKSQRFGPMHSMSGRNETRGVSSTPAPNAYRSQPGQNNKGVSAGPFATLKGRPSPYVYSGFRSSVEASGNFATND